MKIYRYIKDKFLEIVIFLFFYFVLLMMLLVFRVSISLIYGVTFVHFVMGLLLFFIDFFRKVVLNFMTDFYIQHMQYSNLLA